MGQGAAPGFCWGRMFRRGCVWRVSVSGACHVVVVGHCQKRGQACLGCWMRVGGWVVGSGLAVCRGGRFRGVRGRLEALTGMH